MLILFGFRGIFTAFNSAQVQGLCSAVACLPGSRGGSLQATGIVQFLVKLWGKGGGCGQGEGGEEVWKERTQKDRGAEGGLGIERQPDGRRGALPREVSLLCPCLRCAAVP